ncbi:MAG: S16 family serine protease, partial [Candidatus Zixiibacteriota bacterium]
GNENYNLIRVEKEIELDYYGPKNIKRAILERIAIRKLSRKTYDASILCLSGVSGTGKASLAKAIAKALGKEFFRISVGGIDEVEDIKGMQRSIVGALPGMIIRTLRNATTMDPVIYIEDIDSFGEESGSVLSSSFLEAIDPRLNTKFLDDYLGIPINLNRIFFICGTRSSEEIPEIFSSRFEIIELPGYIENEKIMIAKKYIIPELRERHGLLSKDVKFTSCGLRNIIRNYTLEAGLHSLKKRLGIICRYIAREKASKIKKSWTINEKVAEEILGTRQYTPEKPSNKPEIGVATGLAWTGLGGDLMMIEGLKMKGSGEVITTGSLGEVMKESIQAAHSYVRSKADILGIDHSDFDNFDIHIHFPSGAIPKDGPSAGVAVSLVIASVMSERPIPNNIAMTGEITLRGKVLQVGGLIEKISAAYRVNIPKIFIPRSNKKDLKDLPEDILKKTKFILIDTVDEIFAGGLLDFIPSTYTLEKLFADEIERAKNRKKSRPSASIAAKDDRKKKRPKR